MTATTAPDQPLGGHGGRLSRHAGWRPHPPAPPPPPAGRRSRALILRDLVVLRKHLVEFTVRTLVQPFLLCFVFLYVFPKIGQGIGASECPRRRVGLRHGARSGRGRDSPSCSRASRPWPCNWPRSSASPARSRTGCRLRAPSGWWPSPRCSRAGRRDSSRPSLVLPIASVDPCRRRGGPHQPALAADRHPRAAVLPGHDALSASCWAPASSRATSA